MLERARALAERIAAAAPLAARAIVASLRDASPADRRGQPPRSKIDSPSLLASGDRREGAGAFLERRRAAIRGALRCPCPAPPTSASAPSSACCASTVTSSPARRRSARPRDRRRPELPRRELGQAAELGLLGATAPAEYGGAGLGLAELCIVGEELAAVCLSTAATVLHQADMVVGRSPATATRSRSERWLPGLIDGSLIGCLAMTEPEAGSDVMSMRTRAVRTEGGWRLNGTKTFITNGPVADLALVYARTGEPASAGSVSSRSPADAPGFARGRKFSKMGWRGSPTGELILDDCEVGDGGVDRRAEEGAARSCSPGWTRERVLLAAESVGVAQGALEVALAYARERRQFGRPIGEFQMIGGKLADMYTETEAARALTWAAPARVEAGDSGSASAGLGGEADGRRRGDGVTTEAVQVLGGYGYIDEFPVERYMRDAKLMQIGGGTAEIQRFIIARGAAGVSRRRDHGRW